MESNEGISGDIFAELGSIAQEDFVKAGITITELFVTVWIDSDVLDAIAYTFTATIVFQPCYFYACFTEHIEHAFTIFSAFFCIFLAWQIAEHTRHRVSCVSSTGGNVKENRVLLVSVLIGGAMVIVG